jgi:hypothetical protein
VIPATLISPGTYTFVLQVNSSAEASATSAVVLKTHTYIPVASIDGTQSQKTISTIPYVLTSSAVSFCGDVNSYSVVEFKWSQVSGPSVVSGTATGRYLRFNAGELRLKSDGSAAKYTYMLTVSVAEYSSSTYVDIIVEPQSLITTIVGGSERIVSRLNNLTLDGSKSLDRDNVSVPEAYSWTCSLSSNKFVPCGIESNWNSSVVVIIAGRLNEESYYFTLMYQKGSRTASTTTHIRVSPSNVPIVSIRSVSPTVLTKSSKIVIKGYAESLPQVTLLYEWLIMEESGNPTNNSELIALARYYTQPLLVMNPNVVTSGATYIVRLIVTNREDKSSAYSQVVLKIADTPTLGQLIVTPNVGDISSTFTLVCTQFQGNEPLRYTFGFYNAENEPTVLASSLTTNIMQTQLPLGFGANMELPVFVSASDRYGSSVSANTTVRVTQPLDPSFDLFEWIKTTTLSLLSRSTTDQETQIAQVLIHTMNSSEITSDPVEEKQQVRQKLLEIVVNSTNSDLLQRSSMIRDITSIPLELSNYTQAMTVIVALQLATLMNINYDEKAVDYIVSSISNVVVTAELSNNLPNILPQASKSISLLVSVIVDNKIAGEQATVIETSQISIIAYKSYSSFVEGTVITSKSTNSTNSISVRLNQPMKRSIVTQDDEELLVSLISLFSNSHVNENVTDIAKTPVLSIVVEKINGKVKTISHNHDVTFTLAVKPGSIVIPKTAGNSTSINMTQLAYGAKCQYWSEERQAWSSNGCTLLSFNLTFFTCSCSMFFYWMARTGLLSFLESKGEPTRKLGSTRKFIRFFFANHTYLSVLFAPNTNRSRFFVQVERVTLLYISLLVIMCSSVISYSFDGQIHQAAAGFVAALFTMPFVTFFSFLLNKTQDVMMIRRRIEDEEMVLAAKSFDEIVPVGADVDENPQSLMDVFDLVGNIIRRAVKKHVIYGALVVALTSIGYIGVWSAFVAALPYSFGFIDDTAVWVVGGIGITLYNVISWLFFITIRLRLYVDGKIQQWRLQLVPIIVVVGFTLLLLSGSTVCFILGNIEEVIPSDSVWMPRLNTIGATTALNMFILIAALVILLLEPKQNEETVRVAFDRKEATRLQRILRYLQQDKWFPWWLNFGEYLGILLFLGVVSLTIAIIVKFTPQDFRWTSTFGIGIAFDSMIVNPIMLLAQLTISPVCCFVQNCIIRTRQVVIEDQKQNAPRSVTKTSIETFSQDVENTDTFIKI